MAVLQLRNFLDLYTAIREELQIQSTDTTAINRIKRDINIVYNELCSRHNWRWLNTGTSLTLPAYFGTGTASVTLGSNQVALTIPPSMSRQGYYFAVDGFNEIYTIQTHAPGTTALTLANEYNGQTNTTATFRIWTDKIALPTTCREVSEVWHDYHREDLDNVGRQEFRRMATLSPRNEAKPLAYYVGDFVDPTQMNVVAGLPTLLTRASTSIIKTLVFAGSVPSSVVSAVQNGDPVRWRITGAGQTSYNGDIIVSAVSTTSSLNDTVTYVGPMAWQEAATPDSGLQVFTLSQESSYNRYRELFVYPAQTSANLVLHVDFVKDVLPLSLDTDEPELPTEDRIVLLYGALHRSWSRARNPEEAQRNLSLYEQKLTQMAGKLQGDFDKPMLRPSKLYLGAKRTQMRRRNQDLGTAPAGGGGGATQVVGMPNKVAVYGSGGLITSSTIDSTILSFLSGLTSNVQTQLNSKQASGNYITQLTGDVSAVGPGSAAAGVVSVGGSSAVNINTAEIAANAATNVNTASTIVKRDGSGNFSAGTITAALTGNVTGNVSGSAASFTGSLTGDVTGTQAATVVSSVGGSTASNIHAAEVAVNTNATSSATVSTLMKRDSNANVATNNFNEGFATTATAAGTTTLTVSSAPLQQFTGTSTQTVNLPAANTLPTGCQYYLFNRSSGSVTVKDGGGTTLQVMAGGAQACFTCAANGTTAGTWDTTYTYTGVLPTSLGGTGQNSTATFPTSGTVLTDANTVTVTNKSLSDTTTSVVNAADATKALKFDLSGATTAKTLTVAAPMTASVTYTVPASAGNDTFTMTGLPQVLFSKGLTVGTNTCYFRDSADTTKQLKFTLASMTTGITLTLNGNQSTSQTLDIPNVAASDALVTKNTTATLTNKTIDTASNTIKSTGASAAYVLTADGSAGTSWAAVPSAPTNPYDSNNSGLATSVATNAMTVALKQADGATDPSAGAPVKLGFRSATGTSGAYNSRSVTAALFVVISSGATLGQVNAGTQYIWVYALDNAGTVELAVSSKLFDDWSVQSTTAMSGSATSATVLYSTTARTNVPIRVIGRIKNSQTTAGTYAANALEISLPATQRQRNLPTIQTFTSGSGTYTTPAGVTFIRVRMVGGGGGGAGGGTAPGAGGAGIATTFGISLLSAGGGAGGPGSNTGAAAGGTASIGTGAIGFALTGASGQGGGFGTANGGVAGAGGSSAFGGAGAASVNGSAGTAGVANTGGGGQGGSGTGASLPFGAGGAAGGFLDAIIANNLAATYAYTVGAGGLAGTLGTSGTAGGAGGSGQIVVEEYYT